MIRGINYILFEHVRFLRIDLSGLFEDLNLGGVQHDNVSFNIVWFACRGVSY